MTYAALNIHVYFPYLYINCFSMDFVNVHFIEPYMSTYSIFPLNKFLFSLSVIFDDHILFIAFKANQLFLSLMFTSFTIDDT